MTCLRSALACLAIGLCLVLGCSGAAFQPSGDGTGDSGGGSLPDSSTTNTQPDSSVGDPPDGGTGVPPVGCKPVRQCGDDGAHCGSIPDGCNDTLHCGACPAGKTCQAGTCYGQAFCGNGTCDPGENCESCPSDCTCSSGCNMGMCCVPNCEGKTCGDDGCGGKCGQGCGSMARCDKGNCVADVLCGNGTVDSSEDCVSCPADVVCTGKAKCFDAKCCVPNCTDKECGSDGCGGVCGQGCAMGSSCRTNKCVPDIRCGDGIPDPTETCSSCPADQPCASGQKCTAAGMCCTPKCTNRVCGDDGCGGMCGACDANSTCSTDGKCIPKVGCGINGCQTGENCANCPHDCGCSGGGVCYQEQCCTKQCSDKQCGSDGCGGSCGSCGSGQACTAGQCVTKASCGDHTCQASEDCQSCAADCPCLSGQACFNKACCTPTCNGATCGPNGCGGSCGPTVPDRPIVPIGELRAGMRRRAVRGGRRLQLVPQRLRVHRGHLLCGDRVLQGPGLRSRLGLRFGNGMWQNDQVHRLSQRADLRHLFAHLHIYLRRDHRVIGERWRGGSEAQAAAAAPPVGVGGDIIITSGGTICLQ